MLIACSDMATAIMVPLCDQKLAREVDPDRVIYSYGPIIDHASKRSKEAPWNFINDKIETFITGVVNDELLTKYNENMKALKSKLDLLRQQAAAPSAKDTKGKVAEGEGKVAEGEGKVAEVDGKVAEGEGKVAEGEGKAAEGEASQPAEVAAASVDSGDGKGAVANEKGDSAEVPATTTAEAA